MLQVMKCCVILPSPHDPGTIPTSTPPSFMISSTIMQYRYPLRPRSVVYKKERFEVTASNLSIIPSTFLKKRCVVSILHFRFVKKTDSSAMDTCVHKTGCFNTSGCYFDVYIISKITSPWAEATLRLIFLILENPLKALFYII